MSTQRVLVDLAAEEPRAIGALLLHDLGALDERRVVDQQRTAFAAREVLRLVEAEGRELAVATDRPSAVGRAERVGSVLDQHRSGRSPRSRRASRARPARPA